MTVCNTTSSYVFSTRMNLAKSSNISSWNRDSSCRVGVGVGQREERPGLLVRPRTGASGGGEGSGERRGQEGDRNERRGERREDSGESEETRE